MPYVRRTWQNAPSSATPLNAAALNNIEDGVEAATEAIANLPTTIGALPGNMSRVAKALTDMETGVRHLKLAAVGDSMAAAIPKAVLPLIASAVGGLVGAYSNVSNSDVMGPAEFASNTISGTATVGTSDFSHWPTGVTLLCSPGSTVEFATAAYNEPANGVVHVGGGTVYADTFRVWFAKDPSGGSFAVQVDGVDVPSYTAVSTVGTAGTVGSVTVPVTLGAHKFRIVTSGGPVRVLMVGYHDSTVSGLVPVRISKGGAYLGSATAGAWANFGAVMAEIYPDIYIIEAKEDVATWGQSLTYLFTNVVASTPLSDAIGVGSPPVSDSGADQEGQNAILAARCRTYNAAYVDTFTLFGTYAGANSRGLMADGTHPNAVGNEYRAAYTLLRTGLGDQINRFQRNRVARAPGVTFGVFRTPAGTPSGVIQAEPSFGLDLLFRAARWLIFQNPSGTQLAQLADNTGGASERYNWLPKVHVRDSTGAILDSADSGRLLVPRRGDQGATTSSIGNVGGAALYRSVHTYGTVTGDFQADLLQHGSVSYVTLGGNITINNTPSNANSVESKMTPIWTLVLQQDATGGRTITSVNTLIRFAGQALGTAPTLTATANRKDIFTFQQVGGAWIEMSRAMNVI